MKKILPLLALISFLGAGSLIVFAAIGPAGTVKCADEKGICTLSGSTRIAYGANGVFYYKTVPAGTVFVTCDNVTFGDPVYGVVKACYKETLLTQILLPWKNNQGGNVEEKQSNGYLVMAGASKEVTVNYTTPSILNECKKITATTKNIFVPSLTLTEWTKFKAGIGSVGGTITNCVASPVVGYGWDVGTWGVCNAECGTSTNQYRTVQCRELTSLSPKVFGNVVSDTYCSAVAKPIDVQGCIGSNNCPVCNMNGVQDNGETGVDCGGGNCGACGQLQQNISGPSVQCISFGPSTYYKINYYTQTNPDLGLIQDQTYNVAGLGNASFQGYGPLNLTASWAQPVTPIIAYNNPGCNTPDPVCSNGATNPPLCNDIIGEPIDGGWSGWGACIPKDGICGDGLQRRTCNNPSPANGGADCIGRNTQDCQANSCIPPLPGPLNCGTQTKSIMIDLGGEGGGTSFSTESFTAYNGDSWYTSQSDCYPTVCTCDSTSCSILHQPNTLACEGWGGGYDGDGDGDGEGGDGEGN